ncbi:phage virion morphogenesis protein [Cupriavidus metallidurans]|uniref:Phage virion morphogenesis protein n=1 Tax=Cupriavidus metallidurans TaxID=119219 RepID=A0A482IS08_9BURK|nr:phage virion morphogenesis protein [Cupriavidus metallidurans]QBP09844.1 phage virion morphogenesis protein [Cupriavidus metallidurans]
MIEFRLNTADLDAAMNRLANIGLLHTLTPKLAVELLSLTEENFETEGHGDWAPWAESTKAARLARSPKGAGKILQESGHLARSVVTGHGTDYAAVGVPYNEEAKNYAAIQQLGGNAGRGHSVHILARPYLPFTEDGLLPEAEDALLDLTLTWLMRSI